MNRERVLKLAEWIENLAPDDFDMTAWRHRCGAPACIAGHTYALFEPESFDLRGRTEYTRAKRLLDLRPIQAAGLFTPTHQRRITNTDAARVLRHLAETGVVDWHGAAP